MTRPPGSRTAGTIGAEPAVSAVLFDFDHTLFTFDDSVNWHRRALGRLGRPAGDAEAGDLCARVEGSRAHPRTIAEWQGCQRSAATHRSALLAWFRRAGADPALAESLYEQLVVPDGWTPYQDTTLALATLHAAGVPTAVVSNVGWDIRPTFSTHGLADLVDVFVLSCEQGREKPDPDLFTEACAGLGVTPRTAVMVGDDVVNDGSAVQAGLRALLLPARPDGGWRGLGVVLELLGLNPLEIMTGKERNL